MSGNISDQTTVLSNLSITGSLAVGGGTGLSTILSGTISVVTMTVTGAVSLSTTATVTGLTTADVIQVAAPASGLSVDLSLDAWVSAANTVTLQFSNSSSAQRVQAGPVNYSYIAFRR